MKSNSRSRSPIKCISIFIILSLVHSLFLFFPTPSCIADDDILSLVLPAIVAANQQGTLSIKQGSNTLTVTSTKAPTWKIIFATGSGAPGGGTAIAVHIPANDSRSIVEPAINQGCCSALGLDNLEWRWRPWGGYSGTRGSVGYSSTVTRFEITESTSTKLVFKLLGSWDGINHFERITTVTPDGFTTSVSATYAGTPGQDSMWWVMSLFRPDKMDGDNVTVSDDDTSQIRLSYSPGSYRPLPSGISLPYNFHFPLTTNEADEIRLKVIYFAENQGNPNGYEFFDQGTHAGNYYLFYPRWIGSFANVTYNFKWNWRFTPVE